ncbi:hypothetical protein AVEN_268669-1 [Araneus ventricosus]|uniref:Uncharacterized protein n=1 Tax=Araneus ventricosus TaxID=182803 RepID=A0A4Y2MPV1_ARAVE|nr:hypothetical protein AVEN_268669-1 [Araneus ventricosus]
MMLTSQPPFREGRTKHGSSDSVYIEIIATRNGWPLAPNKISSPIDNSKSMTPLRQQAMGMRVEQRLGTVSSLSLFQHVCVLDDILPTGDDILLKSRGPPSRSAIVLVQTCL